MHVQYKSHDDTSLSYMADAIRCLHTIEDVFFLGRAGEQGKTKANALSTEHLMMRKVEKETNAETRTPSNQRREVNACQYYISHETDVSKESDAYLNITMIPLLSYWVEQIP